jgi:tetratricopeptide (TPR) repeat protein
VIAALQLNPNSVNDRLLLGNIYAEQKHYLAALDEYREAMRINPLSAEAKFRAGEIYYRLGNDTLALLQYRAALVINPKFPEVIIRLGDIFLNQKRYGVAVSQYRAALNFDPRLYKAYAGIADVCLAYRRYSRAIAFYRKALGIAQIACEAGDHHFYHKRFAEAIAAYRTALGLEALRLPEKGVRDQKIDNRKLRQDRRRHTRYLLRLALDVRPQSGHDYTAGTVDVSKSGLLIESSRNLEIGSPIQIQTALYAGAPKLSLSGKVVRLDQVKAAKGYRFGVELSAAADDYPVWEDYFAA